MFPINSERLHAGVFTSMLPATERRSRTCATRETDVISEHKHCSRRCRHTQVELSSPRKSADKTQTIARKHWHGARKRKRRKVRSTCGRLKRRTEPRVQSFLCKKLLIVIDVHSNNNNINFFYSAIPTVSLLMAVFSIIVIEILLKFKLRYNINITR